MKKTKELQMLVKKIDDVRKCMHETIDKSSNLTDIEVVRISKMLDFLLNEYDKLLSKNRHAA